MNRVSKSGFDEIDLVRGADRGNVVEDALQRLGIGRNLILGQPLDTLDLIMLRRDREIAVRLGGVGIDDVERGMCRRVAEKAEDEAAVRRDADRAAIEHHLSAGLGLAVDQAALRHRPVQRQRVRERGRGEEKEQE